eukprot:8110591-Pyramimonas_sp.AAC.1
MSCGRLRQHRHRHPEQLPGQKAERLTALPQTCQDVQTFIVEQQKLLGRSWPSDGGPSSHPLEQPEGNWTYQGSKQL